MTKAFIALGANLGDPVRALEAALRGIENLPQTRLLAASSFYRTAPVDSFGPDYVNAVAAVETQLPAGELLRALFSLEEAAHRVRPAGVHNAPRTLDLDLLLYGRLVQTDSFLTLPHPRMHQRAFVLVPLLEIEPDCEIPGRGPARRFLTDVRNQAIEKMPQEAAKERL